MEIADISVLVDLSYGIFQGKPYSSCVNENVCVLSQYEEKTSQSFDGVKCLCPVCRCNYILFKGMHVMSISACIVIYHLLMCRGQDDYSFFELLPMAMLGAIGGLLGM